MVETIKYYFSVNPGKLYKIKNGYYFYVYDTKYYFVKFRQEIKNLDFLVKVTNDLYNRGVLVDTFIKNKDNSFYVNINEEMYILLRVNEIENDIYTLKDIVYFNDLLVLSDNYSVHTNYKDLWMKKIDDYEVELSEYNNEIPIIKSSIDYYIGMAENAVSYFNDCLIEEDMRSVKVNLCHKRVSSKPYSGYINNPLTFTFDYEIRDIAEYIKSCFFDNINIDDEIDEVINKNFSRASLRVLYARLLYPSYYFDMLEEVLVNEVDEKSLLKYINKQEEYQELLVYIYKLINKKYNIPKVEWLFK